MVVSLLGPPLHELDLEDVRTFLDSAEAEPLLWEAKGTELDKHDVRKAVCGFANGHQAAYLILGAEQTAAGWVLSGVDFDGDPPQWISAVVADGLRPVPRVDVRSLVVGAGRHVAVVEVPPVAIPPCFSRGTVYERVSGRTVPVKDPTQLADLYKRGTSAHQIALHDAATEATAVIEDGLLEATGLGWPRFALALSAVGHPPDISSRLFSEGYEEQLQAIVRRRLIPPRNNVPDGYGGTLITGVEQSNLYADCVDDHTFAFARRWHVRVVWTGTVVVHFATAAEQVLAEQLVTDSMKDAWLAAGELLAALGGYGPTHMELRIEGGGALLGPKGAPMPRIRMGRGPLEAAPEERVFDGLERELRRATGEKVYEGEGGGPV